MAKVFVALNSTLEHLSQYKSEQKLKLLPNRSPSTSKIQCVTVLIAVGESSVS